MRRLNLLGLAVSAALMVGMCSVLAIAADKPLCAGCPTAAQLQKLMAAKGPAPDVAPAPAPQAAPAPVPTPAPAVQAPPPPAPSPAVISAPSGQSLTKTIGAAPVTVNSGPGGETTISAGTLADQIIKWAALAFGGTISTTLTLLIVKLLNNAGMQGANLLSDKLNAFLLNGINLAASKADLLQGKGKIEIKNAVAQEAVAYAQNHGADIIKKMGLDPTSGKAVEALRARIETLINDPATPTAPVLDPPKPAVTDPAAAAPAKV